MSDRNVRGPRNVVVIGGQEGDGDPLNVTTTPTSSIITEYNLPLTLPDTEYSRVLPAGCRALAFRCRSDNLIRYAWRIGRVAGPASPYQTLTAGSEYWKEYVNLRDTRTVYFASPDGDVIVEIEAWS